MFGTLWGGLSTSMNVAAGIGPLISSYLLSINNNDWRIVMQLCGTISCGYSLSLLLIIKDQPEDVGLTLHMLSGNSDTTLKEKLPSKSSTQNNLQAKGNGLTSFKRIFSSFYMYALSYAFLIAMFTKGIVSNWGPIYLLQVRNFFVVVNNFAIVFCFSIPLAKSYNLAW